MELYKDQHMEIISRDNKVFVKKHREDYTMKDFETLLKEFPRIKLTNFMELKNLFNQQNGDFVEIGVLLPEMDIQISKDAMTANILFYEDPKKISNSEDELNLKIKEIAASIGIEYGLKRILWEELEKKKHVIAEGKEPEDGVDAKITYFQNPTRRPKIGLDGRADFSDMNFIFEIEKDAWLGEKIPASEGIPGMNVLGKEIPAKAGKDLILKYNPESVYESEENGKIIIRSKTAGVLDDSNGLISILQHLEIKTDIGVETGNIVFNGSIAIKGTVLPGYSVKATGDISIEAKEGVSGADSIESTGGDIYIRGGVFGHSKTVIRAGGSVFLKHANEATIYAENEICIEMYAIGSNLSGRIVRLDGVNGKIIGGVTEATSYIHTAIAGNQHERRTELIIHTIDQKEKMGEVRYKAGKIKEIEQEMGVLESRVIQLQPLTKQMNAQQLEVFEDTKYKYELKKSVVIQLNYEIQTILKQLSEIEKECVEVTKMAFEGTIIKIGKRSSMLKTRTNGVFKMENGELNV